MGIPNRTQLRVGNNAPTVGLGRCKQEQLAASEADKLLRITHLFGADVLS